jgi:hypothetical protein
MHAEIDSRVEALDDSDRSGLYRSSDSEPAGAAPEPRRDGADEFA